MKQRKKVLFLPIFFLRLSISPFLILLTFFTLPYFCNLSSIFTFFCLLLLFIFFLVFNQFISSLLDRITSVSFRYFHRYVLKRTETLNSNFKFTNPQTHLVYTQLLTLAESSPKRIFRCEPMFTPKYSPI